jgi:hypothetical protein
VEQALDHAVDQVLDLAIDHPLDPSIDGKQTADGPPANGQATSGATAGSTTVPELSAIPSVLRIAPIGWFPAFRRRWTAALARGHI